MLDFSRILYVIPIHDPMPEMDTFFQGYSYGILRYHQFIYSALSCPASVHDYIFSKKMCAVNSMQGINYHAIVPIEKDYITKSNVLEHFFTVVFSTAETYEAACAFCENSNYDVLHVTSFDGRDSSVLHFEEFNDKKIQSYIKRNYKKYGSILDDITRKFLDRNIKKLRCHPSTTVPVELSSHNIVVPSAMVFKRLKYKCRQSDVEVRGEDSIYTREIVKLNNEIRKVRKRFLDSSQKVFPISIDCILEFPGGFEMTPNGGKIMKVKAAVYEKEIGLAYNKFIKLENKRRSYSHHISYEEYVENLGDEEFKKLEQMRIAELECYTAAISVMASNYIAPTIRLSPAIRNISWDLTRLKGCANASSNGRKIFKMSSIVDSVQKGLDEAIHHELRELIRTSTRVKIICDYPIEWMRVNDLPLMISKNTSRQYPVPGNVFLQKALHSEHFMLYPHDLYKITIIRSFKENDKIRHVLETAVKGWGYSNLDINIVDVSSEKEFIDAMNSQDSNVLVLDCHGFYDEILGASYLKFGDDNVDIFSLRKRIKVPPIVLLSACETFPVNGRHANIANSFLACGAITVIGTFLEVNAVCSAAMIARFLFRIDMYIPVVADRMDRMLTWLDIASGMFRMVYAYDLITCLFKHFKWKNYELEMNLRMHANTLINSENKDWYDFLLISIAEETGVDLKNIKSVLDEKYLWSDIMSYVQVGAPEKIFIMNKSLRAMGNN